MLEKQQVDVIPRLAVNRVKEVQIIRQSRELFLRGARPFSQSACPAGGPDTSVLNHQKNFPGVPLPAPGESTKTAEMER
jgi:hypothetical protein